MLFLGYLYIFVKYNRKKPRKKPRTRLTVVSSLNL